MKTKNTKNKREFKRLLGLWKLGKLETAQQIAELLRFEELVKSEQGGS